MHMQCNHKQGDSTHWSPRRKLLTELMVKPCGTAGLFLSSATTLFISSMVGLGETIVSKGGWYSLTGTAKGERGEVKLVDSDWADIKPAAQTHTHTHTQTEKKTCTYYYSKSIHSTGQRKMEILLIIPDRGKCHWSARNCVYCLLHACSVCTMENLKIGCAFLVSLFSMSPALKCVSRFHHADNYSGKCFLSERKNY